MATKRTQWKYMATKQIEIENLGNKADRDNHGSAIVSRIRAVLINY